MNETAAIDWIARLSSRARQNRMLVRGIGDDCAIVRPSCDEDLVFTTDFVLEERHFERESHTAAEVGRKALARSLSDLAAMGSEPVFCTVSLAVPPPMAGRWLKEFYRGLMALASEYKLILAGGDLACFEKIVVDVMCCGRVPAAQQCCGAPRGRVMRFTLRVSSAHLLMVLQQDAGQLGHVTGGRGLESVPGSRLDASAFEHAWT